MSRLNRDPSHCCSQRKEKVVSVYALLHDGKIRYIGQTSHSPKCRLSRHISASRKGRRKSPVCCWLASLYEKNTIPEIRVLQRADFSAADSVEKFWISYFRRKGCKLMNFSDGGNMCGMLGQHHSPETRKKMSESATGRKLSKDTIAKIVAKNTGRKQSPEERAARSSKLKGRKISLDQSRQMSEWMFINAIRKPIIQMDLKGEFIKEFPSLREAAQAVSAAHQNLSRAAKNPKSTSAGFRWRFSNAN